MKRRKRTMYTADQVALMWERYRQGESLNDIGRLFDRHHSAVSRYIYLSGGISPPKRSRKSNSLTLSDREEISRGLVQGHSFRELARLLGKAPSTISREISRNGGRSQYRATKADQATWERAKRPKCCKLKENPYLASMVASKLKLSWSPEQISGWLRRTYSDEEILQVSHETIYKTLYVQTRGALKKELQQHLRSQRIVRRARTSTLKGKGLGGIVDAVSISQRPSTIEDRAIPGHWEGDLIKGRHQSYIATLVERKTRFVMLAKVEDCKTETVINALIKQAKKLPKELYKTLTWDRGSELADHKRFSIATDIKVYFCDPSSPWQRGSNENTNRLLREYFPKGTDLSVHSQQQLSRTARSLNERPRKTLDYDTPANRFNQCVALID